MLLTPGLLALRLLLSVGHIFSFGIGGRGHRQTMYCVECQAHLEPEDGHDQCPSCLGVEHLRQGLTEQACINCGCLSWASRTRRLAEVEIRLGSQLTSPQRDEAAHSKPRKRPAPTSQKSGPSGTESGHLSL